MNVISIRSNPEYKDISIAYFQEAWNEIDPKIYENCISNSIDAEQNLPQWYLLMDDKTIIGCAGLITNDFISRMDLYPWLCALYVGEEYRGNGYGKLLIDKIEVDTRAMGFKNLYLCTDHIGYYEKYGFIYIGDGYHPWGETSRIYRHIL